MTVDSRCAAGDRCTAFDHREGVPAERDGHPVLCRDCLSAGERAPAQLVMDYRDLEQILPRSLSQWSDGQPPGSAEAQMPLREDVEALQREICWKLTTWEEVLRDVVGLSDPALTRLAHPSAAAPRTVDGHAVQRAAQIITPWVRRLAEIPDQDLWSYPPDEGWSVVSGWQGVLDLVKLHGHARAKLGITELERELPGSCPECGQGSFADRVLRIGNGKNTVYCVRCDHRRPYDEYERYLRMLVWDAA